MERLAAGRRLDRDGAIPVAELIRRAPTRTSHERLAGELLSYSSAQDDPGRPPLAARLVYGVIGVVLVLTSAVITSMISTRPLPPPTGGAEIRGVIALRPDLVREARWPFASPPAGTAAQQVTATSPHRDASALALADELYRRLDSDPVSAVPLLTPELVGGQAAEVTGAWQEAATVRARPVSAVPGGVITEVEVDYRAGDRVVLRHLLTVEPTATPRISGAELLAARHFDPS